MMRLGLGICAAALVGLPGAAQACRSDPFSVHWGDTLDVRMQLRSAENCRFGFNPGHGSHVESVVISQAPQHGTVSQADTTHFLYHPARGYTGPDQLRVTASGDSMGNRHIWSGDTNYTYQILVTP